MNKIILLSGVIILVFLLSGCVENLSFKNKPIYNCTPTDCNTDKINQLYKDCENSIIISEQPSANYRTELTNKVNLCRIAYVIEKASLSQMEGLSVNCEVPIEKTYLFRGNESSKSNFMEGMKYCEGSLKDYFSKISSFG